MKKDYLTAQTLRSYAAAVKAAEVARQDIILVQNTCFMLEYFADRVDTIEDDAPITVDWEIRAFALLRENVIDNEAVEIIFKQFSLCAREIVLRQGIVSSDMMDVFNYILERYSPLKGREARFFELFKYGIHKRILLEVSADIDKKKKEFESQLAEWKSQLEASHSSVIGIQAQLESQHKQYNFVGLSQAFANLLQKKKRERTWLVAFSVGISLSLLIVPFSASWLGAVLMGYTPTFSAIISNADIPSKILISMPFIAIEIVLIYYFRVFLNNYYNVKAQVIQLELRNSLCQFVEGYIDFAKKIGPVSLSHFESLIYSDLDRPTSNNPGLIDSESLTKIIEAVKKG